MRGGSLGTTGRMTSEALSGVGGTDSTIESDEVSDASDVPDSDEMSRIDSVLGAGSGSGFGSGVGLGLSCAALGLLSEEEEEEEGEGEGEGEGDGEEDADGEEALGVELEAALEETGFFKAGATGTARAGPEGAGKEPAFPGLYILSMMAA